jgi:hypothetical protein
MITFKSDLMQAIDSLKAHGYNSEFFLSGTHLTDNSSMKQYQISDILKIKNKSFTGANPEDSGILFIFECNDGNKGYAKSSFGSQADEALVDFALSINKKYLKINVEQDHS